jgi:hypothetical protein
VRKIYGNKESNKLSQDCGREHGCEQHVHKGAETRGQDERNPRTESSVLLRRLKQYGRLKKSQSLNQDSQLRNPS